MVSASTDAVPVFEDKLLHFEVPFDPPGDPRNPYEEWARRRASNPVEVDLDRFGADMPLVFLYRQADVAAALQDHQTFSSTVMQNMMGPSMGDTVLVGMDEPGHGRYRNLIAPALQPRLIQKWKNDLIHKVVDSLLDRIRARGAADLVHDFNFNFPAQVVSRIVGLPPENYYQFQLWAIDIVSVAANPDEAIKASREFRHYVREFIDDRRANPQDDMISALVHAQIDGEKLTEEEIHSFLLLLVPAGIETTYRSLGSLLFNLLTRPDQLDAVRQDRALLPRAIEENLRFDTPIQMTPRITVRETVLGGTTIPADAMVIPLPGAANRDPAFVEDGERFDIHRPSVRHVTFGNGVHTCIGLHLAKMEMGIAVNKLLDGLPNLRFDWDKAKTIDAHIRGKAFRSPTAVPVLWDA